MTDKKTAKAIEQKRAPTPTLPLRYDRQTETFRPEVFPSQFEYIDIADNVEWVCPPGRYEFFLSFATDGFVLFNLGYLVDHIGLAGYWFPMSITMLATTGYTTGSRLTTGNRTTAAHNITTQAPPGTDTEAAAIQSGTLTETGTLTTETSPTSFMLAQSPKGWEIEGGDILQPQGSDITIKIRRID